MRKSAKTFTFVQESWTIYKKRICTPTGYFTSRPLKKESSRRFYTAKLHTETVPWSVPDLEHAELIVVVAATHLPTDFARGKQRSVDIGVP
jgi:hypothetical protein